MSTKATSPVRATGRLSPVRVAMIVALAVLCTEALTVFVLPWVHFRNPIPVELVDGMAVVLLTSPVLYLVVVRPLERLVSTLRQTEALLEQGRGELEQTVAARTAELSRANEALKRRIGDSMAIERELRESELRYRQLVEMTPDAIFIQRDQRFAFINPAGLSIFGATDPGQIIGKPILERIHPEWREQVLNRMQMMPDRPCRLPAIEVRYLRLDGSWVDVECMVWRFQEDGKPAALVVARDITERNKTREELRKLSRAVEQSPASILITDLAGGIEYVNPAFCRLTGYSREEALGNNPRMLKSDQTPPEVYRDMWAALTAGKLWRGEICNRKKNGDLFWELAVLSPLRNSEGVITHFIGVKEDITERKSLEKQLLRTQRVESIGTLAAGVAHDLNNILAPILISAQLLQSPRRKDDYARLVETIEASAKRAAAVVKQVLTFAQGTEGQHLPVQPRFLLHEIKKIIHETFPKNVTLECQVASDTWPVIGDITQLYQILLNLCVNARDAMPSGGILTLVMKNVDITRPMEGLLAEGKTGQHVLLRVTDTGVGMAAALLDRIFDPFFTTKEQGKGSGLGLSTVLGLVRSHRGFLNVRSEPGHGSTFDVYLPAGAGEEGAKNGRLPVIPRWRIEPELAEAGRAA